MVNGILEAVFSDDFSAEDAKIFISVVGICLLCLLILISVIAYFWHLKDIHDGRQFTVTREGLGEQSGKIKEILLEHNVSRTEVNSDLLLLEEIIMRLQEHAVSAVTVRLMNRFGHFKLQLSVRAKRFNPLAEDEDLDDNGENFLRGLILQANLTNLSYARRFGKNIVIIRYS